MKTLLYCYRSGIMNNWLGLALAGVLTRPLTCPPLDAGSVPYERLREMDLLYIALHGDPSRSRDVLYGDDWRPALEADQIAEGQRLDGLIVILEGCWGAATAFPAVFEALGATVAAARAPTWDKRVGLGRAGRLGMALVRGLRKGKPMGEALTEAKQRVDQATAESFCVVGDGMARLRAR